MNEANPQQTLSETKLSDASSVSTEELQYHFEGLRSLFVFALLGLIAMTVAVDVAFIRRQKMVLEDQLNILRPRLSESMAGYRKTEPLARSFIASLQNFTNSNPDFQPVLERYRPSLWFFLTPPVASSTSLAPASPAPGPATK